jgi:HSP20 family molecular chaperone IbpA
MSRFVEPVKVSSVPTVVPSRVELFRPFEQVFDKFFDDMFSSRNLPDLVKSKGMYPKIDIYSDDQNWVLEAHCPGVAEENLTVEITREASPQQDLRSTVNEVNVVTISGRMEDSRSTSGTNFHLKELSRSAFVRKVALPSFLDDKPTATMKDGVLKLTWDVPTKRATPSRVIPINKKD